MQLADRILMLNKSTQVSGIKIVNHIKRGLKVGQQQITCEFNGGSPSLLKGSIIREGMATLPFLAKRTCVAKNLMRNQGGI